MSSLFEALFVVRFGAEIIQTFVFTSSHVTGFTPEAPRATVAAITAPSACGLRYRVTRTTDSFRFPPSTWPAGQTERLAITSKSTWAPGRRSCAGRRLPSSVPTALNGVAYANGARYQLIYRWKANVVAKG